MGLFAGGFREKKETCEIIKERIGNRLTFKCKKLARPPTAEEIVDSLKFEVEKNEA